MKDKNLNSKPILDQEIIKTDNRPLIPLINLTQLKNGESAKVIRILGGWQVINKLEAMEIVPGAIIVKKTASLMQGPIVIEKGNVQFAIGYGMAKKIIVEPIKKKLNE